MPTCTGLPYLLGESSESNFSSMDTQFADALAHIVKQLDSMRKHKKIASIDQENYKVTVKPPLSADEDIIQTNDLKDKAHLTQMIDT